MVAALRLGLVLCLVASPLAEASRLWAQQNVQSADGTFLRSNPKFLSIFRPVVSQASKSTVRVLCDGKDTALGMVVGADGWILTKANDLKGNISCRLKDGRVYEAKLVGRHEKHDLAMLKINATGLVPVSFKDTKGTSAGQWVACAGLGDDPVAVGVIGVATRNMPNKGLLSLIDPSNSGYLGIGLRTTDSGVLITDVMPKSAAEKAGIKPNDYILALDGARFSDHESIIDAMLKHKAGDIVVLKIKRDQEELDLKATLGKRPKKDGRSDFQNNLGSKLSSRRTGYPTVLQHDGVMKPEECGGPIVDLDGRVIGINICRAGRTESWAVPAEVVTSLLSDLKSGKLAPPQAVKTDPPAKTSEVERPARGLTQAQQKAQAKPAARAAMPLPAFGSSPQPATRNPDARGNGSPAQPKKSLADSAPLAVADRLLGLMKDRLLLMEDVARAKWNAKKPIADPEREKQFLDKMQAAASSYKLDKQLVHAFFRSPN